MSRIRTGITPDAWLDQGSQAARSHGSSFVVPAVGISMMRPVLTPGGNTIEGRSEDRQKALRVRYTPGVSGFGDDLPRTNPDNGAVEAPITEVQA